MPGLQSVAATVMYRIYGIFAGLAFIAITLPTVLLLAVIPGLERRRRFVKGSAALILRTIGARPEVSGAENLPAGPCVAVANHCSYLDGMILTGVLPARFAFVIKREMTHVPFANFLLQRIGSEFVERFDRSRGAIDARRIMRLASRQQSLAFFPEGTFRAEPGLRRFHNGAFAAAVRGELPVVPIVIRGSRDMLPAEKWLARPGRLQVIIQPPIDPGAIENGARDLLRRCRESMLTELDEPDLTADQRV
jgi:1-acyl-sn-glycerol-3-phosphate acyltransferase